VQARPRQRGAPLPQNGIDHDEEVEVDAREIYIVHISVQKISLDDEARISQAAGMNDRERDATSARSPGGSGLWLGLATACLLLVCGAGAYEHAVLVPVWTADPPGSLAVLHGSHALQPGRWWAMVHWPTLLFGLVALVRSRGQARWRWVGLGVGGYVLVLAVTMVWFVPELFALIEDPTAAIPPAEWKARADRWEVLSLVRLAVMFVLGAMLLQAMAEPSARARSDGSS
jgi:hypothetical protein